MDFTDTQRGALTRLLDKLGPDAPTIIDWTTHDLAAHLWVRENDLLALPGIGIPALAGLTEKRMERAKARYAYPELVRRLRRPPFWTKLLKAANAVEFFVHKMDVLRANPTLEYAPPTPDQEDVLWGKVRLLSFRLRKGPAGIVLERSDTGQTRRVSPGAQTVTVLGRPSELLMYLTGRLEHARVEFVGTDHAVPLVRDAALGL